MNKVLVAIVATAALGVAGCASTESKEATKSSSMSASKTSMSAADKAIAAAEKEVAAVKKAGHEWKLIDKSTGRNSAPLSKMLAAAKKARDAGNEAEAIRIANRVAENAKLGLQQAKEQAKAGPHFPK